MNTALTETDAKSVAEPEFTANIAEIANPESVAETINSAQTLAYSPLLPIYFLINLLIPRYM